MPSTPPPGEPAPADGSLPESALESLGTRPFGVYVHVPYCAHRCGYCDFNTYVDTTGEAASYVDDVVAELRLARRVLGIPPPASTLFFGGGTPTLLPVADLARVIGAVHDEIGLRADAEVTVEANPETLDADYLRRLRRAGATRLSLGMQSTSMHVLSVLERRHTPGTVERCVVWAREAGFEQVSVDLIFGTPGESLDDWRATLDAAVAMKPDHVSAYSLIVEPGTRLAAAVARGEIADIDEDLHASMYEAADEMLSAAGYAWYEISNWATHSSQQSRHNVLYWHSNDWWGIGPGAHSHVGGTRWWNVRLPRDYATAVRAGSSPAQAREILDTNTRRVERIMLGVRLATGHPAADLTERGRAAAARHVSAGLLDAAAHGAGRLLLTRSGRLLADAVIRDLVD